MINKERLSQEEKIRIQTALHKKARRAAARFAPIYKLENWTWWQSPEPPDEDRIYQTIQNLIGNLDYYEGSSYCMTGGIRVGYELCGSFYDVFIRMELEESSQFSTEPNPVG